METTARRYSTPATPPRLVARPEAASSAVHAPVLCLQCAGGSGHAAPSLVSFAWGRVSPSYLRR